MEDDFTPTDWYESEAMKQEAQKAKEDEEYRFCRSTTRSILRNT